MNRKLLTSRKTSSTGRNLPQAAMSPLTSPLIPSTAADSRPAPRPSLIKSLARPVGRILAIAFTTTITLHLVHEKLLLAEDRRLAETQVAALELQLASERSIVAKLQSQVQMEAAPRRS
ncbi:hypothetical protein AMAG_19636 [Allomyces macrogynus ATCC 38327]|uniref:Uncharacterized protein n=1 Tax=Allomyces macrogynus (strain ATCC 38327) TaxID=578462 RepID=A0A0L0SZ30_ALLM3|nr:hypothetical protein AMAG_19636 [Allomyces macrogynus ATCC 38327]|eukprot:KNE67564.1 hypothetical protein AMAG_19636 [Allomyces macrogynus ATCC 38327]